MTPLAAMLIAGAGGLALFLVVAALMGGDAPSGALARRLARVSGSATPLKPDTRGGRGNASLRRATSDSSIPLFDRLIKALLPNPDKLRARLERTGKPITLGVYVLINILSVLIAFLVLAFGFDWARLAAALMGIAIGLWVPHKIVGRMGDRRIRAFLASFPEAIDTICRGLRSGLPVTESIGAVGRELPDPIGIEFRRINDGVRMGRSLEDSMWEVSKRLDTPEFRFFIIALAIQRETGGNLAETLGNLADLLRKRRQLRLKIRAMSSEARASAMIIGSLPFVMFGLLMAVNSEYMMILLTDLRGKILVGGGLGWIGMGVMVMKNMINFEI